MTGRVGLRHSPIIPAESWRNNAAGRSNMSKSELVKAIRSHS
jgi:hypothetical protein